MLKGIKTSCAIFNARMRDGASVTDHVLYMIEMIEHLSKLGFPLHEQLGKDAILNSLPKSFLPFLTHFRMTKPAVNYHGLLGLLQNFEKDHQLHKESVNVVGDLLLVVDPFKKGRRRIRRCSCMLGCLSTAGFTGGRTIRTADSSRPAACRTVSTSRHIP
ncbi:hypothetical protein [Pseudomonas putida]|uniref:hypothetical protein n=1 Tax=Pseudomonas putida TaxID=303 RepID=UPI001071E6AF